MHESSPADSPAKLEYTRLEPPRNSTFSTLSLLSAATFAVAVAAAIYSHPRVRLSTGLTVLLSPVVALMLGLAGRSRSRDRGVRDRAAAWGIALGSVELTLVAVGFFAMPLMCRSSAQAENIKCASNLRQIGQALMLYAMAHGNECPPDLDTLVSTGELTPAVFTCPSSNDVPAVLPQSGRVLGPGHCSYVYLRPRKKLDALGAEDVLAYESRSNHGGGMNILFGDGEVEWLPKPKAMKVVTAATTQAATTQAATTQAATTQAATTQAATTQAATTQAATPATFTP